MDYDAELKKLGEELTIAINEYDKNPNQNNENNVFDIENKVYDKMTAGNLPTEVREVFNALNEYDKSPTPENRENVAKKYTIYYNNRENFKDLVSHYVLLNIKDRIEKMFEQQGGRRRTKRKLRKVAKKSKKSRRYKKSKKSRKSKTSRRR
jgi:hypothetical protein